MTFFDMCSFTRKLRDKFRMTLPKVYDNTSVFVVTKRDKKVTVEVDEIQDDLFTVCLCGQKEIEPVFACGVDVAQVLYDIVEKALEKK